MFQVKKYLIRDACNQSQNRTELQSQIIMTL